MEESYRKTETEITIGICFYGNLKGIRNVTVFVGTDGIFYPDITKFFGLLDEDPTNELIVGEEMNHVYPLFPIPEAKPAVDKIILTIHR